MLCVLQFITLSALGTWAGKFFSIVTRMAAERDAREAIRKSIETLFKKSFGIDIRETPDGIIVEGAIGAPPDEDPIDRVIRESNELARRKARGGEGGGPPVS
jgi:hypothetical protein